DQVLAFTDASAGTYKKIILRDNRIVGAVLLGDCTAAPRLLRTFHKREAIRGDAAGLVFSSMWNSSGAGANESHLTSEQDAAIEATDEPLKEVIAVIRPERWLKTKSKVESLGITAVAHHRVLGRGRQRGLHFLARRGAQSGTGFRFLPKRM